MYNRRGPSKGTPATVKCQKCLKHGHYSYECKANVQERPYVARPSRTQQLSNPKLVPKLTEAAPPKLQKKEGVADQQLAKLEAERARRRELDQDDAKSNTGNSPHRGRSPSYDSVSTVSTSRSLSGSPRPSARRMHRESKSPSYSSRDGHNAARSPSPIQSGKGVYSHPFSTRRTASPEHGLAHANERSMRDHEGAAYSARGPTLSDSKRYSSSVSRSPPPSRQRRYRSRSAHQRQSDDYPGVQQQQQQQQRRRRDMERGAISRDIRERSMSPFSKRLALTKSMQDDQ